MYGTLSTLFVFNYKTFKDSIKAKKKKIEIIKDFWKLNIDMFQKIVKTQRALERPMLGIGYQAK